MKYLHLVILFLFILVVAGCGGDDEPEATPFEIQEPDTGTDTEPADSAPDTAVPPTDPPPATVTPLPPTDTATPTATPTPTLGIPTAALEDITPLSPIDTPAVAPDLLATVAPILTAFPDLDIEDIDPNNLPELPGGIELPDLPLPPLPGG